MTGQDRMSETSDRAERRRAYQRAYYAANLERERARKLASARRRRVAELREQRRRLGLIV